MTIRIIVPKNEAEKYFFKDYVNMIADTSTPIATICGVQIFTTNEDIKEAIMFDLADVSCTKDEEEDESGK